MSGWETNGFLDAVDIVSSQDMINIKAKINQLENSMPGQKFPPQTNSLHFQHRFLAELAIHPNVLNIMRYILGPDLVLIGTSIVTKYPQVEAGTSYVGYHQDLKYWGITPLISAAAWIALDLANSETASMQFLPGSHKNGLMEHGKGEEGNLLQDNQHIHLDEKQQELLVQSNLKPGQASFHNGLLVHGSHPNYSSQRRSGLVAMYTTPEVTFSKMDYDNEYEEDFRVPVLVEGKDKFGNINYVKEAKEMLEDAN